MILELAFDQYLGPILALFDYAILLVSVSLIMFLAVKTYFRFVNYQHETDRQNRLLHELAITIGKHRAIQRQRNRITVEMCDTFGSGLTRIKFLGDKALRVAENEDQVRRIEGITRQCNQLVSSVSEAIWALNSRFDDIQSLVGYLRRYSREYLDEHQIHLSFLAQPMDPTLEFSAEKRYNIHLVVKQILHAAVKCLGGNAVHMGLETRDDSLVITLHVRNVKGTCPQVEKSVGNGWYNIQKRSRHIGGQLAMRRTMEDMTFTLSVPLEECYGEMAAKKRTSP